MADLILVKCGELGDREEMPKLQYDKEKGSEIAVRTDEKAIYIGTPQGNTKVGDANWEERIKGVEETSGGYHDTIEGIREEVSGKLTAVPAQAQTELSAEATLTEVVGAYNTLLAALKAGGIMEN